MWGAVEIVAMLCIECLMVGLNTISKASMIRGMNNFVFTTYATAIGLLFLLPLAFFYHRVVTPPKLTFSIVCRICILGFIGYSVAILNVIGIGYSSPTMASAILNLTPAYTVILARITRMEKLDLKSKSSQTKFIGTIVTVIGALTVTLYQGPTIIFSPQTSSDSFHHIFQYSTQQNWVLGGLILAASSFSLAVLIIFQAIFTVVCGNVFTTWVLRKKGPVFVIMFKPLDMIIALVMGITFLGDCLYIGSVIGGVFIALGFYSVLWGKANEEKATEDSEARISSNLSFDKLPLLAKESIKQ